MNNNKLLIETLEMCAKLIQNCTETLKAYEEEKAKFEKDYLALYETVEVEYNKNKTLDEKLTRILNGETKNENRNCCVRTKRAR
jgi:hypothetical protein